MFYELIESPAAGAPLMLGKHVVKVSPVFGQGTCVLIHQAACKPTAEMAKAHYLACVKADQDEDDMPIIPGPREWGVSGIRVQKECLEHSGLWVFVSQQAPEAIVAQLDALGAKPMTLDAIVEQVFAE